MFRNAIPQIVALCVASASNGSWALKLGSLKLSRTLSESPLLPDRVVGPVEQKSFWQGDAQGSFK
jgi:hypothetical protein